MVAATSGDTGSAAIAALGGLPNIDVFVLHPKGRVSEVQRRQMTTSRHANVHNIALEGSFDDAQGIVKGLFAETEFAREIGLTAVNSINFVRIAAQSVYYFTADGGSWARPPPSSCPPEISATFSRARRRSAWGLPPKAGDRHQRQRHHGARVERRRL